MLKAAAPACVVGFSGAARTPRVEKKLRKSATGPSNEVEVRPPPAHSMETTVLPALSAASGSVSACNTPVEKAEVRSLKLAVPLRKNVLLVEPCLPGYVPVAKVYQPTPVLGGKACTSPLSPVAPSLISLA